MTSTLLLVGCGNMGGALLSRWQQAAPAGIRYFHIIEPGHARASGAHAVWHKELNALPADVAPSIVVFAVKPQQLSALLPQYRARFGAKPLYISIAAGKSTAFFRAGLGEHAHVVRAMPNTPALAGHGMTVLCAADTLPESAKHAAASLMQAVGKVEWADESLMDAVTAISGSGPAYVFYFLEALAKAGVAAGLSEELAKKLALETVSGSAALAQLSNESFENLRRNVTSPGGTTEAALAVLQNKGFEQIIHEAVEKAKERSGQLAE